MKIRKRISDGLLEFLKENYCYDKDNGKFIIKNHRFRKLVGKFLRGCVCPDGYVTVSIRHRETFLEHRLVFFYHNGFMPDSLDHINGNRSDNRIENLRISNDSQNQSNRKKYLRNGKKTSRYKGVCRSVGKKNYRAYIYFNKKRYDLGTFKNEEDAARAYDEQAKLFFGDFVHTNF